MSKAVMKDTGGPAFPSATANPIQDGQLSVRDYFAAQALIALIGTRKPVTETESLSPRVLGIAMGAYDYADAMLKERAK